MRGEKDGGEWTVLKMNMDDRKEYVRNEKKRKKKAKNEELNEERHEEIRRKEVRNK